MTATDPSGRTDPHLVSRLRTGHPDSWLEFVREYTPLIEGVIRRQSVPGCDIDPLVGQVFEKFFLTLARRDEDGEARWRYDPAKSLRNLLKSSARNIYRDYQRARLRGRAADVHSAELEIPDEQFPEVDEHVRVAAEFAKETLAVRCGGQKGFHLWRACRILGDKPVAVAAQFFTTVGAVYTACHKFDLLFQELFKGEFGRLEENS